MPTLDPGECVGVSCVSNLRSLFFSRWESLVMLAEYLTIGSNFLMSICDFVIFLATFESAEAKR